MAESGVDAFGYETVQSADGRLPLLAPMSEIAGRMAPQEVARMQNEWANKSEAKISADAKRGTDKISSIRVLESRRLSDDEVVLTVYAAGGEDKVQKISVKRIDAEWKLAGRKEE